MATTNRSHQGGQRSSQRGQAARRSTSGTKKSTSTRTSGTSTKSKATAPAKTTTPSRTSASARPKASTTRSSASSKNGTSFPLPYVTAELHTKDIQLPDLHMPSMSMPAMPDMPGRRQLTSAVDSVRAQLPSRERAVFYGALAAGTVFSIIEWPVALAIGAATAVIGREKDDEKTSH